VHFATFFNAGSRHLRVPDNLPGRIGTNARALGAASLLLSQRLMADQCAFLEA
jgi:hypothetical protein